MFFVFNAPATPEIYTLSLHDALPISCRCLRPSRRRWRDARLEERLPRHADAGGPCPRSDRADRRLPEADDRSEEHTSELQSHSDLVCRLLLEKKKKKKHYINTIHNKE